MKDITNLFKATVKTLKSRNKAQGINSGPDKTILPSSKKCSDFGVKSKLVVSNITKLKEFLLEHRTDYLSATSALGMGSSKMTDAERDQIDADAEKFIKTCSDAIKSFKDQANGNNTSEQVKEHREVVFFLAEFYLKEVCKLYSEQKAIRVKRVVDRKRIGRLEPEGKRSKSALNAHSNDTNLEDAKQKGSIDVNKDMEEVTEKVDFQCLPGADVPPIHFDDDDEISPEEAQMFEEENQELYDEMNSLIDEVKQIEGKVVEISRLQEIFADKVLEQETDIDRIAHTVVGATENIKDANEEIREAMKNNAGLRVWILFFLIVCSFSLLFLDWYNA